MPSQSPRFALVCLTAVIVLAALLSIASRVKPVTHAAESEKMPALQGDEAKAYLQQQNSYASLQEAIKAARYQVNVEATPFADLPTALQVANPAQNFNAYFTSAGMVIAVRDEAAAKKDGASAQPRKTPIKRLEMRLEAIGYGEQLSKVPQGELHHAGNRIELRRGAGLVEWYENRPEGLEQGFRLDAPPEGRDSGAALRLKLVISGEMKAEMEEGSNAVSFRDGSRLLSYDGLKVYDANGQELKAQMKLADEAVWLEVDERDAVYPLTIDPMISQQQKFTLSDGAAFDQFGGSVAISGESVVVGAHFIDVGANVNQGSAYVFVRSGTVWSQQQKLTASDGAANDEFGYSVAISGESVVVGAHFNDVGANADQGSAYVFVRSGTLWSQQQKLTASDGVALDQFGNSVAISGENVVVGAPLDDVGANGNQGSAYVFVRSGTVWSQQQKLTASTGGVANGFFGNSVAISGESLVVGAVGANGNHGLAYVFVRNGTLWSQQQQLFAPLSFGAGVEFGISVAISGESLVVGAHLYNVGTNADQGLAIVFVRSGTLWSYQQILTASDGAAGDRFGSSVAISGESVVVGAVGANAEQGSAYVFARAGTVWSEQQKLTASDGAAGDFFGYSVAISGESVVVGASADTVGGNFAQGSAYVFACTGTQQWIQQTMTTASDGAANDLFGRSVAISGESVVVGAPLDDVGANADQGSAYVFVRNGTVWSQQQKLTASTGEANDEFGISVGISGESVVVGAHLDDVGANVNRGVAYVFIRSGTVWSEQDGLVASDGSDGDEFGISVAISGETLVVGANMALVRSGKAYVFVRSGGFWDEQQKLTASDREGFDQFGTSVAISGETVVVGAPFHDVGVPFDDQGSAYVYVRSGTLWSQQQKLTASDGAANDQFGGSVAISGESLVVGANVDNVGANSNQGSAYVFVRSGGGWSQQQKLTASDGAADDQFGISVAISGESLVVGAHVDNVGANSNQGSAYVFARAGAVWSQRQQLTASDGAADDQFGISVAISGESLVVGANADNVGANSNQGSAYIFFPQCVDNIPPTITANGVTRNAGGSSANSQIATAGDAEDAENILSVTVNGGASATVTGVMVSGISVSAAGVVTANVVAACGATTANFTLRVTDSGGLFAEAPLTVTVNPDNQPPTLSCPANITTTTDANQCTKMVSYATPTASDNCPGATVACNPPSSSAFVKGTTTVTCTATDTATPTANTATCTFTVTVNDTQAPAFSGCTNVSANTASNSCNAVVTYTLPTASDNCDGTRTVTCTPSSGSTFPKGVTTVTCSASDANTPTANTATCSFTVTVTDNIAPVLAGCTNVSANTASNSCNAVVNYTQPTATDNCDGTRSVSCSPTSGSVFPKGITTVSCSATDANTPAANTGTCTFTVTVTDNVAPVLSGCTNVNANTASNACTAVVTYTLPTASDNCDGTRTVTCTPPSGSPFPKGVTTVTCTATDTVPNTGTCSFTVTVTDNVAPVLAGCTNVSANTASNSCNAVVNYTQPTATDNCDGTRAVTCTPSSGSSFPKGTTTVNCSASDAASPVNTGTCSFLVTVSDNVAPVLNGCTNVTANTASNSCNAVVNYTPTANDNCDGTRTVTCTPASGTTFPKGVTTVTCSASDTASPANTATCSFTVTVNDTQAPAFSGCTNISANTTSNSCNAVVNFTLPTANDNCDGTRSVTCSPSSGSTFPKGVTTVTCSASDANTPTANTATCSFTVTVNDVTPPIINCPANIFKGTDANLCSAVTTFNPTGTDNCSGIGTVTCTPASGSAFPKGTTTVNCSVSDAAGNQATCSFSVTVNDTQAPAITCPANVSLPAANGSCSAVVTYAAPAVSDNCPGVSAPACSPASGSTFPKGTTIVNCSVSDAAGNSRACSFTVSVVDTQAPSMVCPANLITNTVNAADASIAVNFAAPVAADNCSAVSVACVPPSGSAFARGTTTVTCTATDSAGNQTTCSFTVKVFDYVIVDDTNGRILRFISTTGEYDFFDCRKGTSLSGQGQVTLTSCKAELRHLGATPKIPDRNLFASANYCTKTGNATVTFGGVTSTLNDANLSNNINRCP